MDEITNSTNDNQSAPTSVDNAAATVTTSSDNTEMAAPAAPAPVAPEFDYKKGYEDLSKNQKDWQSGFTRATQRIAALEKMLKQQQEAWEKQNFKPASIEDLTRNYQTLEKQLNQAMTSISKYEINDALRDRRADSTNYPDFKALEPVMYEIASSGQCPIDLDNNPPDVCLDILYKLAFAQKGAESLAKAREQGRNDAESQLAKEAKTAVAGSGKSVPSQVPDFSKMTLEQERAYWVKHSGEAAF